jgi:hypothetical protein
METFCGYRIETVKKPLISGYSYKLYVKELCVLNSVETFDTIEDAIEHARDTIRGILWRTAHEKDWYDPER